MANKKTLSVATYYHDFGCEVSIWGIQKSLFLHKDDQVVSTKTKSTLCKKNPYFSYQILIIHNKSHATMYVHLLTVQFLKIVTLRDSLLNDSLSLQDFISCSCMLAQILEQTGFWNLILRGALKICNRSPTPYQK